MEPIENPTPRDPATGDENKILELFERVFEQKRGREFWRWENKHNPRGESIIALFKEGEELRGHLSLQPVLLKVGEEELLAGQRINSMIDEEWRGKGRFKDLFDHLLEKGREQGFSFTYFFPNQQALRATQKNREVIEVAHVPRFVKFYSGFKAAQHLQDTRVPRGLAGMLLSLLLIKNRFGGNTRGTVELCGFDERFDELWERVKGGLNAAVVRDTTYLNWRYAESPRGYRIFALEGEAGKKVHGYLVLYREDERGLAHIVDFLAEDKNAVKPLLNRADRAARQEGCWALSCWILDDGQFSSHLKPSGFLRVRAPNILGLVDIQCSEKQREVLSQPGNWYLTIGDSDYV